MGLSPMLLLVGIGVLFTSCSCQDADDPNFILRSIVDGQYKIFQQLNELDAKVVSLKEEMDSKMLSLKEELVTVKEELVTVKEEQHSASRSLHLCDNRDQLTEVKEILTTKLSSDHQQCASSDQLADFQALLGADECQENTHNCSEEAVCTDSLLGYQCSCRSGYSGDGFTCQDIDECVDGTTRCDVHELCQNEPGNYTCICQEGYTKEGQICQDIDECSQDNIRCGSNEVCSNTVGSFVCNCGKGFEREGNSCEDIDECSSGVDMCDVKATCTNTMGNYSCHCSPPYTGDGYSCVAKSSCDSLSVTIDGLGCVTVIRGATMSWSDADAKCKGLGMRLLENVKQVHLQPLGEYIRPLIGGTESWIGFKHQRWLSTGSEVEQGVWQSGQPSGGDEVCGMLDPGPNDLGLEDYFCRYKFYPLCQNVN